jgi:flagellar protein FliJ
MPEKFRLHTVLRLRLNHQEERQAELAQVVQAIQILQGQMKDVQQQLVDIENELRTASTQQLNVDHLMALRRHQSDTRGVLQQLEEQQHLVEQEIERRQNRLREANRDVQVIETLAQQHRDAQFAHMLKREQETLDDFAQKRVRSEIER